MTKPDFIQTWLGEKAPWMRLNPFMSTTTKADTAKAYSTGQKNVFKKAGKAGAAVGKIAKVEPEPLQLSPKKDQLISYSDLDGSSVKVKARLKGEAEIVVLGGLRTPPKAKPSPGKNTPEKKDKDQNNNA